MTTQGDEAPPRTASAADGAGPKAEAAGVELEASPPQAAGRRRFRYTLPGAWVALAFIGYGVGVAGAWTWRAFADRDPHPPRPGTWRVFAISAAVALVLALVLGQWWQAQLRDLMG